MAKIPTNVVFHQIQLFPVRLQLFPVRLQLFPQFGYSCSQFGYSCSQSNNSRKALLLARKINFSYFRLQPTHPPPTRRKVAGGSPSTTKSTKYKNQGVSKNYVTKYRSQKFQANLFHFSNPSIKWVTNPQLGAGRKGQTHVFVPGYHYNV